MLLKYNKLSQETTTKNYSLSTTYELRRNKILVLYWINIEVSQLFDKFSVCSTQNFYDPPSISILKLQWSFNRKKTSFPFFPFIPRPFGDMMCKTVQYMIVVTCLASVYTLVLMSLDRFLAVVHPISSMSIRTEKNALM